MSTYGKYFVKHAFTLGIYIILSACNSTTNPTKPIKTERPLSTKVITTIVASPLETVSTEEATSNAMCPQPCKTCKGEIEVSPGRACAKPRTVESWEMMGGEQNFADWGFGVGTFLEKAAYVHFPDDELILFMQPNSEIKIPDAPRGDLELVGGQLEVQWNKTIGNILRIIAGGEVIDPNSAIYELSYHPEQGASTVKNFAGEITIQQSETRKTWSLLPWQEANSVGQAITITNITKAPPNGVQDWLTTLKLPVYSPWQTEINKELEKPPALDPLLANDAASQQILRLLMEGLYSFDSDGNLSPAGAISFNVSPDGLTYTFKLRKNAKWSDGISVTAQDYAYGICRYAMNELPTGSLPPSPFNQGLEWLKGGSGQVDCANVDVRVIDDYTLILNLKQPLADIRNLLTSRSTYPVRADKIKKCGSDKWTQPGCFVSNGPYMLKSGPTGNTVTQLNNLILAVNPYYWNSQKSNLEPFLEFTITSPTNMKTPSPIP